MTDNTQELDEILRAFDNWCTKTGFIGESVLSRVQAKQSLLDWHNKQIVSELENYIDWIQRLHAEPEDSSDRWSVAAIEIVAEGRERINQLKESSDE